MPDTDIEDLFGPGTGLHDDFDLHITTDTKFLFDPEYNDGKSLVLKLVYQPEDGGEEEYQLLSIGSGLEDKDDGRYAVDEKTGECPTKRINGNSRYYAFMAEAMKVGANDILIERGTESGVGPYDASIWHGLRFHAQQGAIIDGEFVQGAKGKNPTTGVEKNYPDLFPTEYLGTGDGPKKAAGAAKKATPKAAAKAAPEEVEGGGADIPAAMKMKLKKIAKEVAAADGKHDDFIERAVAEIPGLQDNEAAAGAVVEESFYEELAS